jgi:hypothetical protein
MTNKVQNILLGLLLIASLASCNANTPTANTPAGNASAADTSTDNTSAESRRDTLVVQKEHLINKLNDQIVEVLDMVHRDQVAEFRWGENGAPDQDQAASAVKLCLAGLCGCLESKEVQNVALRGYVERSIREEEGEVGVYIFHLFTGMLDGELSGANSAWLTGFLKEFSGIPLTLRGMEAKMLLARVFEDTHSLFKVMKEIRQLT